MLSTLLGVAGKEIWIALSRESNLAPPPLDDCAREWSCDAFIQVHLIFLCSHVCMIACLEYLLELICFDRVAKLGHRAGFDLPNTLPGYVELLA